MSNESPESEKDVLHEPKEGALSRRQFLDILSKSAVATAAFSLLAMTDGAADAASHRSHLAHRHGSTNSPYHPYAPYHPYHPYCGHPYGPPPPYHPYGPPPPYHPYGTRNPYKVY